MPELTRKRLLIGGGATAVLGLALFLVAVW